MSLKFREYVPPTQKPRKPIHRPASKSAPSAITGKEDDTAHARASPASSLVPTEEHRLEKNAKLFQENAIHTCADQTHDVLGASAGDVTSGQALEKLEANIFRPDAACDSVVSLPQHVHDSSGITDTESAPAGHFPGDNDVLLELGGPVDGTLPTVPRENGLYAAALCNSPLFAPSAMSTADDPAMHAHQRDLQNLVDANPQSSLEAKHHEFMRHSTPVQSDTDGLDGLTRRKRQRLALPTGRSEGCHCQSSILRDEMRVLGQMTQSLVAVTLQILQRELTGQARTAASYERPARLLRHQHRTLRDRASSTARGHKRSANVSVNSTCHADNDHDEVSDGEDAEASNAELKISRPASSRKRIAIRRLPWTSDDNRRLRAWKMEDMPDEWIAEKLPNRRTACAVKQQWAKLRSDGLDHSASSDEDI